MQALNAREAFRRVFRTWDRLGFEPAAGVRQTLERISDDFADVDVDTFDADRIHESLSARGFTVEQYETVLSSQIASWDDAYSHEPVWTTGIPDRQLVALLECQPVLRRALDLGCGDGTNVKFMASRGMSVVGLDVSARALELARDQTRGMADCDFVNGNVLSIRQWEPAQFDLVFDRGCMHHVPVHLLATYRDAVARLLRPGGVFLQLVNGPLPHGPSGGMVEPFHVLDDMLGFVDCIVRFVAFGECRQTFSVDRIRQIFSRGLTIRRSQLEPDPHTRLYHLDVVSEMERPVDAPA